MTVDFVCFTIGMLGVIYLQNPKYLLNSTFQAVYYNNKKKKEYKWQLHKDKESEFV